MPILWTLRDMHVTLPLPLTPATAVHHARKPPSPRAHAGGFLLPGVRVDAPDDPTLLTDEQRADLISHALADGDGPVTRWVVAYEQANGEGFSITSRDSGDAPWILYGMAAWLADVLMDHARGR